MPQRTLLILGGPWSDGIGGDHNIVLLQNVVEDNSRSSLLDELKVAFQNISKAYSGQKPVGPAWALSARVISATCPCPCPLPCEANEALELSFCNHLECKVAYGRGGLRLRRIDGIYVDGPAETALHGTLSREFVETRLREVAEMMRARHGVLIDTDTVWNGNVDELLGRTMPTRSVHNVSVEQGGSRPATASGMVTQCHRHPSCIKPDRHVARCKLREQPGDVQYTSCTVAITRRDAANAESASSDDSRRSLSDVAPEEHQELPTLNGTLTELYARRTTGRKRSVVERYAPVDWMPTMSKRACKAGKSGKGANKGAYDLPEKPLDSIPLVPVPIKCGTAEGVWDPRVPCDFLITRLARGNIPERDIPPGPVKGTVLEKLGGRSTTKNYKTSVRVVQGNGASIPLKTYAQRVLGIDLPCGSRKRSDKTKRRTVKGEKGKDAVSSVRGKKGKG
jgi:hypothetical protein